MEAVEVHGTLGESELLRAAYFCQLRRTWLLPLLLLAPFLLAAAAIVVQNLIPESSDFKISVSSGAMRNTMPFVFIFLVWCAFNAVMPILRVRKLCATVKHVIEPSTLVFTAAGVRERGESISSEFRWTGVMAVVETRTLFLIFNGQSITLVPKRYFQSPNEMSSWREIVEAGIAPQKIARPGVVARCC
jgi:hypothetical protein